MNKYLTIPYSLDYKLICDAFHCGNSYIDNFIHTSNNHISDIGKTYLWINDRNELVGFYNITTGCIDNINEYGNRVKLGGSIHINQFAISNDFQNKYLYFRSKYSDVLLSDCISRILYIRDNYVGFSFITLMSTEEGHSLYLRNGFEDIEDDMYFSGDKKEKFCYPMYLALGLEDI